MVVLLGFLYLDIIVFRPQVLTILVHAKHPMVLIRIRFRHELVVRKVIQKSAHHLDIEVFR